MTKRKPLQINISGEPEEVNKILERLMPRGPTEAEKELAAQMWKKSTYQKLNFGNLD